MGSFTICYLAATVCSVRVKEGEMDGHVARMGNKKVVHRILVEQHDSERPSGGLSVVVIIRLKCVIMK
jgi:hypothetical protein